MGRGAWWATIYKVAKSWAQLDRSEMFTELYRDEKKEEGDRGGQKDKRGE